MGYLDRNLMEGETVVYRTKLHWIALLPATLLAIVLSSLSIIRWNRRLFARLAEISERRSELAQKLIAAQESTLRYISRELHDEFGQVLTAVGSMLRRAGTLLGRVRGCGRKRPRQHQRAPST
jgi:glucose-6-phosphate-specific signal transduction histidine kinase